MNDLKTQILAHMDRATPGQVWAPTDFAHLGGRDAVDKALQRLVASDQLRRIDRGLYDRPRRPQPRTTARSWRRSPAAINCACWSMA